MTPRPNRVEPSRAKRREKEMSEAKRKMMTRGSVRVAASEGVFGSRLGGTRVSSRRGRVE